MRYRAAGRRRHAAAAGKADPAVPFRAGWRIRSITRAELLPRGKLTSCVASLDMSGRAKPPPFSWTVSLASNTVATTRPVWPCKTAPVWKSGSSRAASERCASGSRRSRGTAPAGSRVLLGIGDGEYYVASDASAVLEHTRSVVYLNDGDVAVVSADGYRVIDRDAREQNRAVDDIEWDLGAIELGGHAHFMQKEIFEQPDTVRSTLRGRLLVDEGTARLNGLNLTARDCDSIRRIQIVACGTSWHAGLVGR